MKLPIALRVFLVHALFTIGIGALAFVMIRASFEAYANRWEHHLATAPAETIFQGSANEIARALLLRLEKITEVKERDQDRIVMGLNAILKEIPSIRSFLVIDRDRRIQYANESAVVDLAFTGDGFASSFASDEIVRKSKPDGAGGFSTWVMAPIFDVTTDGTTARRRLGSLVVEYVPDMSLARRLPSFRPEGVSPREFMVPLLVFVLAAIAGGVLVGALIALPVRRLDRALAAFKARGFRGPIEVSGLGLGGEMASAVKAINEMGGRLESMDSQAREREALLATLSQSLEEGMVAIDERGVAVAWNAAALRILRIEAGNADAAALKEAFARHPELAIGWSAGVLHSARTVELARPDGPSAPVQVTEVPFEPRPGAAGTLVLMRDLATLRKVETHLLEAGRFAVLAHLAGSLAHEIRNPLHSIGVNASVVQQYVGPAPSANGLRAMSESLTTIQGETRRLTDLLNNYLGLLRSTPESGPVDVRDVCRRVIQLLSYAAMKSRVELTLEGDADIPPVHGVPDRLQQAILNLALNAIQAMPHGGRVALRTTAGKNLVRVSVTDTGPGLPGDVAERLFDAHVTTKPGGSGLGLSLVRMIAEAHGGSVWYRSDPGSGATFTLVLPALREAA